MRIGSPRWPTRCAAVVDESALAQGGAASEWFRGWADARRGNAREGYRRIRAAYEGQYGARHAVRRQRGARLCRGGADARRRPGGRRQGIAACPRGRACPGRARLPAAAVPHRSRDRPCTPRPCGRDRSGAARARRGARAGGAVACPARAGRAVRARQSRGRGPGCARGARRAAAGSGRHGPHAARAGADQRTEFPHALLPELRGDR